MQAPAQPSGPRSAEPATPSEPTPIGLTSLSLLAVAVGVVTGFGAVGFRALIGLIHNLLFLGQLSFGYDANLFTPASPWGPLVILVPVIGGFGVTFLVTDFAPEARGHGVPEVMDAIYYRSGVIRPGGRGGEVAGLGARDRQRRRGRPRGPDHPDRLGARLDPGPDHADGRRAADHPGRGRRRRRHRRDLQHADRRA